MRGAALQFIGVIRIISAIFVARHEIRLTERRGFGVNFLASKTTVPERQSRFRAKREAVRGKKGLKIKSWSSAQLKRSGSTALPTQPVAGGTLAQPKVASSA